MTSYFLEFWGLSGTAAMDRDSSAVRPCGTHDDYFRTHAGQGSRKGMADRQGGWQTGGRRTPRLVLLRQYDDDDVYYSNGRRYSRRGRNLFGKGGLTRSVTVIRL